MSLLRTSPASDRPYSVVELVRTRFHRASVALALVGAAVALSVGHAANGQTACDADVDGDGAVGASDLARVLGAWGPCEGCATDVDGNGAIDAADISVLLSLWGQTCSPLPWATVLEEEPNPTIVTSAALRAAILATGLPWRVVDDATGIEMVLIPPGTFDMGCSASNAHGCNSSEFPVHAVTITGAFYLGRYEVTQSQWTAVMGSNPSTFQAASPEVPAAQVPMRPVDGVSWNAAQGFLSATGLRLPTEAEWEYAFRAGTITAFHGWPAQPSGTNDDTLVGNIAWYVANSAAQTRPVGGKAANGFGLHDIAGNVQEWVNDWFGPSYYSTSPATDPPGPSSGFGRVLRGGAWINVTNDTKASARNAFAPEGATFSGFRAARNPL